MRVPLYAPRVKFAWLVIRCYHRQISAKSSWSASDNASEKSAEIYMESERYKFDYTASLATPYHVLW